MSILGLCSKALCTSLYKFSSFQKYFEYKVCKRKNFDVVDYFYAFSWGSYVGALRYPKNKHDKISNH